MCGQLTPSCLYHGEAKHHGRRIQNIVTHLLATRREREKEKVRAQIYSSKPHTSSDPFSHRASSSLVLPFFRCLCTC